MKTVLGWLNELVEVRKRVLDLRTKQRERSQGIDQPEQVEAYTIAEELARVDLIEAELRREQCQ